MTEKIQNEMDDCAKSGKTLFFEKGTYKTGTESMGDISDIKIENLTLENITASLPGGVSEYEKAPIKYIGDGYPQFHRMDVVPAKGIYIRDTKNTVLKDINLSFKEDDVRELIVLDNAYINL